MSWLREFKVAQCVVLVTRRVVSTINKLPGNIVAAPSVGVFKDGSKSVKRC